MKKFILALIGFLLFSTSALAEQKISDIQVEGLQIIDVGLVFNSIPFEINDDINSVDFSKTISLLYSTGQFKNVVVEREGTVIIISVREKPLLFELNFSGAELFQPDALTQALAGMNIASGLVIDEVDLARAEKEIEAQYLSAGKYNADVKYEMVPLTNNRVNVIFTIDEGGISRIKEINIVGNLQFKTEDLLDKLTLKTTNYMSWWNKDDRYSKQVLTGDLEKIKSFYMDKGYLDFKIESSIVSISKNKKNVFIDIAIDEGKKYTFGDITVSGTFPEGIKSDELSTKVKASKGNIFSRRLVNESVNDLSAYVGNFGYAFANVNALPTVNKIDRTVDFNFNVDPGKKIYVRRINIVGNTSTKDEVVRREMRQYESSWFSREKVDLSKRRLTRTQYFESVSVETPTVPGSPDQVDLNLILKETNTGKFNIGAGVSSSEGIVGTLGLSQANFFGTGQRVSTSVSLGGVNKVYQLGITDPYWTDDGVSRGFTVNYRDIDTSDLDTGDYKSTDIGAGLNFGIPLDEFRMWNFGANVDFTEITLQSTSPQSYIDYCNEITSSSSCNADAITLWTSWNDNTIDNPFFATQGHKISVSLDVTTPGLDLEYYKVSAKAEKYFPLSQAVATKIKAGVGYADTYGDNPYPFFKNFRLGGKSSIRGFKEGSVGKKVYDANYGDYVTEGGEKMINFGAETFFPVPFMKKSDQYRLSTFIDGGGVFEDSIETDEMRYSAGIGVLWMSPFGPLSASIAWPLNEGDNDQTESFQFGMGSSF